MSLKQKIMILSLFLALGVWVADAAIDKWFFYEGTFLDQLVLKVSPHEIYQRTVSVLVILILGAIAGRHLMRRQRGQERLMRLNSILHVIRNVNQLIVRESNVLAGEICDSLVCGGVYDNAWIALVDESGNFQRAFESGLGEKFNPMRKQLEQGQFPPCWNRVLDSTAVRFLHTPDICGDSSFCLSSEEKKIISARLAHGGRVYGMLTVCAPMEYVSDDDEHSLLVEVAGDIALALHDIEAQQQHEKDVSAMRESERQYRELFNALGEGFVLYEVLYDERNKPYDYRFMEVNPAFEKQTGLKSEQVIGKTVGQVLPEIAPSVIDTYNRVSLSGKSEQFQQFIHKPKKHFEMVAFSPDHHQLATLSVDVTARIHAEEQFRQAQKMEAIGRLAGGIAHDFRNQLTVIKGYADMLVRELSRDGQSHEAAEQIGNAAQRATIITNQLLSFGRKDMLQPEVVSMDELLADLSDPLSRMIGEDIQLSISVDPGMRNIMVDRSGLQQAIMNLVVNARDAMPSGGRLKIDISNVNEAPCLEEGNRGFHGHAVMLTISDTGIGMDKETRERIFEPFFTTKEVGKGTGLGLSMVYGFVNQSGGCIEVDSEPGQGTTFRFFFPPVDMPAQSEMETTAPQAKSQGSETIFVVEDEQAVRQLVVRVLRDAGYMVMEAGNARQALPLGEGYDGRIDLLITDIIMPHMNGVDMAKQLLSVRPEMKVLYISGYAEPAPTAQSDLDEGTNFLAKPFDPNTLTRTVRKMLDENKIPDPATA